MCSKLYVFIVKSSFWLFKLHIGNSENLGDGFCDSACNNAQCAFDLGDCKDVSSTDISEQPSMFDFTNQQIFLSFLTSSFPLLFML